MIQLLEAGMVMIHLDARSESVSVPEQLRGDPHLRLNLSYRFRPCDIKIDDDGVQATLTFGGTPWLCRIPFSALFGMTSHASGESLVWLEDVPEEVLFALIPAESQPVAAALERAPAEPSQLEAELSHAVGAAGSQRRHLRLVK